MDPLGLMLFMGFLALGSYTQAVTGFALTLVAISGIAALDLMSLWVGATVVSFLTLANMLVSLRLGTGPCDRRLVGYCALGMLPFTLVGVLMLELLGDRTVDSLRILLAVFVMASSLMLILRPVPYRRPSGAVGLGVAGMLAGIFGGLYGAAGPPIIYQFYRQPIAIEIIRNSLMAAFILFVLARLLFVLMRGGVTLEVLWITLLCLPVVAIFAWVGSRFPPPLGASGRRRLAFALLFGMGALLLVTGG